MSNKIGLSVFSTVMMGFLAVVPVAYPEAAALLWWRIAAITAFVLGVFAIFYQGILQSREESRSRLLLEQIASSLSTNDSLAQNQSSPLRERTARLAHDLFAFLRDHGPEPPNPINHLATLDKEWEAIGNKYWPYRNRIQHSYARTLHPRVVELLHELAEKDMNAPTLGDFDINPDVRVEASALRGLAEKLLLIAAKMD